jgi:hypothetical protein
MGTVTTLVPKARNTHVVYQYRDAHDWKAYGEVILAGEPTEAERATITAALGPDGEFLPAQVGLPTLYDQLEGGPITEDDPVWHELTDITTTDGAPTLSMTATQFAAQFDAIEWDLETAEENR